MSLKFSNSSTSFTTNPMLCLTFGPTLLLLTTHTFSAQSSKTTTIQTIWPTTLGTSKLHTTYNLYHWTLYMMVKHKNVPPNCHNPNHTTNHTWNFKIRQHLHLISSNFGHHAQVHNFSTQPQTPKVLGPSMLFSSIHGVCYSTSSFYLSSSKRKSLFFFSTILPLFYFQHFTLWTFLIFISPYSQFF